MFTLTLSQVAQLLKQQYDGEELLIRGVSTDTRSMKAGDIFVALRGENYDANEFLARAEAAGAVALVVEKIDTSVTLPQLLVENSVQALGQITAGLRKQFEGKLVGITGSSGKTTVKEMLAAILATAGETLATAGNLNNHIGVPLTLSRLAVSKKFAVIEMGASAAGEIAYLSSIARPDVVLVNNVMAAHLQGFGDLDGVAMAKGEIYQNLGQDGRAIINLDEAYAEQWSSGLSESQILRFSVNNSSAEVFAANVDANKGFYSFELHTPLGLERVQLAVPGEHNVSNALAAASCALACGVGLSGIKAGLESAVSAKGRLQHKVGVNGCVVIDDSYNANPGSVAAAMEYLAQCAGRRIFILGDMGELGENGKKLHKQVGKKAQLLKIDELLCVGDMSQYAAKSCEQGQYFTDKQSLLSYLELKLDADTTVVVKGSRSMAMENVVAQLVCPKVENDLRKNKTTIQKDGEKG